MITHATGTASHLGPVLGSAKGTDIIDCQSCGFAHAMPLPGHEELARIYSSEYYATEKPDYFRRYEEDRDWWRLTYDRFLSRLETLLPAKRRALLEIGSGPGLFLERAVERGWAGIGVEPARQAVEYSRNLGLDVREGNFDADSAGDLGSFDAIHLHNVLEHVLDPTALLALAAESLTTGGVLSIVVPNDFNALQRAAVAAAGSKPWWLAPPHHLNYFSFVSLERLLVRLGFEIAGRTTTFPMELFLLMGDDYTVNGELGRSLHAKRKRFEQTMAGAGEQAALDALYDAVAAAGLGRECVVWGRKR